MNLIQPMNDPGPHPTNVPHPLAQATQNATAALAAIQAMENHLPVSDRRHVG